MFFHVLINTTFGGSAVGAVTCGKESEKPVSASPDGVSANKPASPGQTTGKELKPRTIAAISPNSLYFSDGSTIKKGQSYEIKCRFLLVIAVHPDYVEFELPGGKLVKVSTSLLLRM